MECNESENVNFKKQWFKTKITLYISNEMSRKTKNWFQLGAIIGDGDRKRVPFLVLGLAPWYRTIFLFLEQIAPSPSTHARTCCEDFGGCRAGKMDSRNLLCFWPDLSSFMSFGIWLKYFRRKLLQFEWSKTVSNLGLSSFISLTKSSSAASSSRPV